MKKFIALYVFLLTLVPGLLAADIASTLDEFDAYLDLTASQLGDSPFAAVVSKNGEIIYERYHDGQGALARTVDEQSRWQIFSITKSFASALVLRLCQEGVLTLDDPVSKYLPDFRKHGDGLFDRRMVIFRHLLSHTSGAAFEGNKVPDPLPPGFDRVDIVTEPGKDFKYSGLGMLILERALEAATGKDMDTLLNERLIQPLGLKVTGYVYPGTADERVLPLTRDNFHYSQSGKRAGAGLFTTARDLNKFGQFWLDPVSMFSKQLRQQAWTYHGTRDSDQGRYGLMWWLFEDDGGYVMSGKDNKINAVIPETNVVVTVIRYPQAKAAKEYNFARDKRAMVLFGETTLMKRRTLLKSFAMLPLATAGTGLAAVSENHVQHCKSSLNVYSFNRLLRDGTVDLFDVLEFCATHNFDAIDPTGYYFPGYPEVPPDEYINAFKRKAFLLGLDISGTGVRNDFANPDQGSRTADIELIRQWIEVAAKMGSPNLRIFAGKSPHEGFTREQVFEWMARDIKTCCEYGEQHGVIIALQNHNDFLKTAADVEEIFERVGSPWLGLNLDIGSYRVHDPYAEIERNVKRAITWQIKENVWIDGVETPPDLQRLAGIIRRSGYRGYLPLETLGPGDAYEKIPSLLEKARHAGLF